MVKTFSYQRVTSYSSVGGSCQGKCCISFCYFTQHVDGKINVADPFTKETEDTSHFEELCDLFMCHSWFMVMILFLAFEGLLVLFQIVYRLIPKYSF